MALDRPGAFKLFTVAGVEIHIDYSWLVVFALFVTALSAGYFPSQYPGYTAANYFIVGFVATVLLFGSVLAHELCHAAMANRLGEEVHRITLFIFGGMAELTHEPKSAADEFKIAIVGPLSSLALAAVFWLIAGGVSMSPATPLWESVFSYLAAINFTLALFNLLPGFPLDGGRLLRAFLWYRTGNLRRATARAADWGNTIAWGLIVIGVLEVFNRNIGGLWLVFIGFFLRSAAYAGYQTMMVEQVLGAAPVSEIMVREPVTIAPELSVADAVEQYFLRYGYGGYPVGAGTAIEGVISLSDVRQCASHERHERKVRDIMRKLDEKIEIAPSATISDALHRMAALDTGRLLIMDQGRLAGLITRSGIARFVQTKAQLMADQDSEPNPANH